MDLDTSLETTPPTGGTVTTVTTATASCSRACTYNKNIQVFTVDVSFLFVFGPAVCLVVHEPRRAASKSSTAKRTRTTRSQSSKVSERLRSFYVKPGKFRGRTVRNPTFLQLTSIPQFTKFTPNFLNLPPHL